MRVSTMRRVDQWLGLPACVALTATRPLTDWLAGKPAQPMQRILFVKLAEQGSTVLAVSAIRRAVELVGRDNVYFLVFEENRFILDVMDLVPPSNVFTIRIDSVLAACVTALQAISRLKQRRIDAAIDLEFFARSSAALCLLSGARRRVGLCRFGSEGPRRGNLMTHHLRYNPHLHTSQTFRLMVEALEAPSATFPTFDHVPADADDPPPQFEPRPQEVEEARTLLQDAAGTESFEPLILLNANAGDLLPLRRWPQQRYVELARRLIDRYPQVRLAFTGAPPEAADVKRLVEQVKSPRCFNLAGRTTLRRLLVTYGLAEVLVTNDSGPAHFAALTGIDVVVLFGPETPKLFAARTRRTHVFWEGIACSPCVSVLNNRTSSCRDNVCMQRIDVDRVFKRVCAIYEQRVGGRNYFVLATPPDR